MRYGSNATRRKPDLLLQLAQADRDPAIVTERPGVAVTKPCFTHRS
jgi:hypothetical protein